MKIVTIVKIPANSFDICHARKCNHLATSVVVIRAKYDKENTTEQYSFCDKHIEQLKQEVQQ
jgi:hypothetical protein